MTRVLCLTSWFPPHHTGGYELSCHDVMRRLSGRGHHVEVLTSDHRHEGVDTPPRPPVAAVHRRLRLYFRDGDLWAPSLAGRLEIERANQRALADALASCRPDVVSIWHVGAMSLGLITTLQRGGYPIVYAVSDDWPTYARGFDAWTRLFARLPGIRGLVEAVTGVPATVPDLDRDAACFISEVTRERCRARSPWSFPRSAIVYSGIDGELFTRPAGRERSAWRWRLLYVGRIDDRKGTRTLLRALTLLPEATLTIDGRSTDEARAALAGLARDVGVEDRVRFQASARDELPEVYRAADVCVFPSEWAEPFGLVPLEAMACGTPVVATGTGGSGEFLVDGGNCVLFEAGDPGALAAAVRRVADRPTLRDALVHGGETTARSFDAERLTDAFEAWHAAAADGYPAGPPPSPPRVPSVTPVEDHGA